MMVPVVKKIMDIQNVSLERALPAKGLIHVKEGMVLKPFDTIGDCIIAHSTLMLPPEFKPKRKVAAKDFYHKASDLGKINTKTVAAPYNGYLLKNTESDALDFPYIFVESESKFHLLSGVWGIVQKVHPDSSVLIKTQFIDLMLSAATDVAVTGELVVFPNPNELLREEFLEKFIKDPVGKIVYMGDFNDISSMKKAAKMGVAGVLSGSCDRAAFAFAKERNIALGVISGFGKIPAPANVYKLLNVVSHRQVFFQGERNLLRIPMPEKTERVLESGVGDYAIEESMPVKVLELGNQVQVFQRPYFGQVGIVDSISESSIFVRFGEGNEAVEILSPNFYIFE